MLAAAADEPDRLVVGIDANAAGMATASRRAAATPRRGGLPNALFVVAAIGALPRELDGLADVVTVHFPWGSLLRGLLGAEPIREPAMRALAASYASWGLAVTKAQPATATDIAAAHSTWGKRLGAGARRPAWLLRARLEPAVPLQATAAATEEEQDEQDDDDDQQQRGQSHGASLVSRPPTRPDLCLTYVVEAVAANR